MITRTFARGGGGNPLLLTLAAFAACALLRGLSIAPASAQSGSRTTTPLAISPDGTTTTGSWNRPDCLPSRTERSLWVDHYTFTLAAESRVELELVVAHATARPFNRAGCDWVGVFAMSRGEYDYWAARAARRGADLFGRDVDATYRCPQ